MNVTQAVGTLIANVLDKIKRDFYKDRPDREFNRDRLALMKAVATYGYECNERGWSFETDFIYHDLLELLKKIRIAEADIQYLPVYLAGAVRRRIGQRAEELSARTGNAKAIDAKVAALVKGIKTVEAVREPTAVEVLAEVYIGIKKNQRQRRLAKQPAKDTQAQLL